MSSYYSGAWGYFYYSTAGEISVGTDGETEGNTYGGWYYADPPFDLAGDSSVIFIHATTATRALSLRNTG